MTRISLLARALRLVLLAAVLAVPSLAAPLLADGVTQPQGDVLLTVSGAISPPGGKAPVRFDRQALAALGPVSFTTTTTWTEGEQSFTGIPLSRLMQAVGATGKTLSAQAINDYAIDIPASDWVEGGPIVAYLHNGQPMSVRDKGPLWIVYPYDARPAYQTEVIYSRSIWQLDRIVVRN